MKKKTKKTIDYSKLMLAVALDVTASHVGYAVKTDKLVVDSNGYINLKLKKNSLWLKEQLEKGKTFEPERIIDYNKNKAKYREAKKQKRTIINDIKIKETKFSEVIKPNFQSKSSNLDGIINPEIADLSTLKIQTEIEYKQGQIALNKIKEQKYSGILVPTDAVKNLFNFAIENMRALFQQELHSVASIYQQRTDMQHKDFVLLQKDLTLKVVEIMKIYKKQLKQGVEGIVDEYQEVRNRGEAK